MLNLTSHSLNPKDEPILQQLQNHLQHLSQDKKAAIAKLCERAGAIAALYEATEPQEIYFDYICDCLRHCAPRNRCPHFNKVIALLQDLSKPGLLALARAITDELAVLEQLQGVAR